jgi:glycosyltransferase involved in cell wall biosynthesis
MTQTIIHIAPTPFFSDRGCHIRIRNEIESIDNCDVRTILCTYHLGYSIGNIDIRRTVKIPGYTKIDVGFSPFKFIADILLFFLVLKTAYREKADILHAHLHEGVLIGWAVKWCLFWRKLPLIMDMQGSLAGELIGYGTIKKDSLLAQFVFNVENMICKMPALFLCSSNTSRAILVEKFKVPREKTILLVDSVPDMFFHPVDSVRMRKQLGISLDKMVVMYSGSFLPGKGIQFVLESIKKMFQLRSDFYYILIGYPVEDARHYLEAHDLQKVVNLQGRVAYDDLASWLSVADIALDPKEETTGEASGKTLHYMAAGLPVVCFATRNNRDLLGDNGYFAAEQTDCAFADMVSLALDDHDTRVRRGELGRKIVEAQYSLKMMKEILLHEYCKLHGDNRCKSAFAILRNSLKRRKYSKEKA